jgi:hypothetical protein
MFPKKFSGAFLPLFGNFEAMSECALNGFLPIQGLFYHIVKSLLPNVLTFTDA